MSGLRTLIVDLSTQFGGADARVLGLLQGLPSGLGALAALEGSPVSEQAIAAGLELHRVGHRKFDPRICRRIARLVREHGFHVVDTQNPQSQWWGTLAVMLRRSALVSTLNSWYLAEHQGNWKGHGYQTLEWLSSGRVDRYVAVSSEIQQRLRKQGVAEDRISLIENAVNVDAQALPGDGLWLRRTFGLPERARVACAVGRLVRVKGFGHLIAALDQMGPTDPPVSCLIVGDGELRGELSEQISQRNLQHRVRLAGFLPRQEVLNVVKSADWFVMPSLSEGTPLALLEAGALGKPIVASRVGGIPGILVHERHGILVEPGNPDALGQAFRRLLQAPQEAAAFGRMVQRLIAERYGVEACVQATRQAWRLAHERRFGLARTNGGVNLPFAAQRNREI